MAVTARQLQKQFGITRRTLSHYTKKGILPAPLSVSTPGKPGVDALWPDAVVGKLKKVRAKTKAGQGIDEIAKEMPVLFSLTPGTVRVDWSLPAPQWPTDEDIEARGGLLNLLRYFEAARNGGPAANRWNRPALRFDPSGPPPAAVDVFRWELSGRCEEICGEALAQKITAAASTTAILGPAAQLLAAGYSPVLVWSIGKAWVTPDFMLTHEMSALDATIIARRQGTNGAFARFCSEAPRLVIPIAQLLSDASIFSTHPLKYPVTTPTVRTGYELEFCFSDYVVAAGYTVFASEDWPTGRLEFSLRPGTSRVTFIDGISNDPADVSGEAE